MNFMDLISAFPKYFLTVNASFSKLADTSSRILLCVFMLETVTALQAQEALP